MDSIKRGRGLTASERYLGDIADKTFLDLWTYPNAFTDRKKKQGEVGKELCDLLVVCGDDIIIFSDKSISWPESKSIELSWSRWYRRAISESVKQIRGAERWLREQPDRVYIDPLCTQKLPLPLPSPDRRRVHGIAVALGAQKACSAYHDDPDGSLIVLSLLKGDAHTDSTLSGYMPFAIGDVDPDGPFVHVFDDVALNLIMREMDTVSDFVNYLQERQNAIRGNKIAYSPGEAEMVAEYMQTVNSKQKHVFPGSITSETDVGGGLMLHPGSHLLFFESERYLAKKAADADSYIWDFLIKLFTKHIIAGTSVSVFGELPSADLAEPALRIMARESRFMRRVLGDAFKGALIMAETCRHDRFARMLPPNDMFTDPSVGYVFMIMNYPRGIEIEGGYQQYRKVRASMLETYCSALLQDNRSIKCAVGIAIDSSFGSTEQSSSSEDLIAVRIDDWSEGAEQEIKERRALYDIANPKTMRSRRERTKEYPVADAQHLNRQQRRAAERKAKKSTPKPRSR